MTPKEDDDRRAPAARRDFFKVLGSLGAGGVTAAFGLKVLGSRNLEAAPAPPPLAEPTGNVILRMQQDLERAISPGAAPSWLMVVDTRKCIGCDSCTVACRAENPAGPGGAFRRVIKKELPISARPWVIYKPANCLQCDDAPCMRAVPKDMMWKRSDGIVELDPGRLRGPYAQAAAQACPIHALHVDDGVTFTQDTPQPQAYESRTFVENGVAQSRKPELGAIAGAGRKCTFCSHLLDVGVLPACVSTCLGGAMYFGDANDKNSLVSEVTQGRRVFKGHQNQGLKPRVIYFEESMPGTPHIDCSACHS
ncbi:MAG: hypothetical protein HY858_17180 [Candidatus Solibacter usitatus]|nr:hypothetical protein [Candidatus Solibacter usitatus]